MKHHEVVTLAEMREILTRWDELSGTVTFLRRGEILADRTEVGGWVAAHEAQRVCDQLRIPLLATLDRHFPV